MGIEDHKFKKGQGGRPLGIKNRISHKFMSDLMREWNEHGAAALRIARVEDPIGFCRLAAAMVPKEEIVDQNVNGRQVITIVTGVDRGNNDSVLHGAIDAGNNYTPVDPATSKPRDVLEDPKHDKPKQIEAKPEQPAEIRHPGVTVLNPPKRPEPLRAEEPKPKPIRYEDMGWR